MNRRPYIVIANYQVLTAQCLKGLLEPEFPDTQIVTDGQQLLETVAACKPDLVLIDLGTSREGCRTIRYLRALSPATKVMVLTGARGSECVMEAFEAGASAFVLKSCSLQELVMAIRRSLNGERFTSPSVRQFAGTPAPLSKPRGPASLTSRQCEVLQLVARGCTAKEIAQALNLSVKTAVFHKTAIMDKLALRTTAELTRYALEQGLVSSERQHETRALSATTF